MKNQTVKQILKKMSIVAAAAMLTVSAAACGTQTSSGTTSAAFTQTAAGNTSAQTSAGTVTAAQTVQAADAEDNKTENTGELTVTTDVAGGITEENGVYTIMAAGTYTFSGTLAEGQIVVDAADEKVEIVLSGATLTCSTDAVIKVIDADKVTITAADGTYNELNDTRAARTDEESEESAGAVYGKCDMVIAGTGSLVVNASYNNGIHTTKDLTVKDVTLKVTALNNAVKGNDSVTVESGEIIVISEDDGIVTENTDVSSKGNQRGIVTIAGGTVQIETGDDGIHAAYDVVITGGSVAIESGDDAIHADSNVTISDGTVQVSRSAEGIEGNVITIDGGDIWVYATDDGINAAAGTVTPHIQVNGGTLTVVTASGDTDGIDSNGTYTQTGGFVLVMGGAGMGGMAGSVDTDGAVTVTGGTLVALGGVASTPSGSSSVSTVIMNGQSFSAGTYTVTDASDNTVITFTVDGSYQGGWIASEALAQGSDYTLSVGGSSVYTWSQSSQTVGSAGNAGRGGMGGMGGRR